MDPQAKTPEAKPNARRRLIRGSFSVPAVLAVHNGSALAASSSKLRCAVNATTGTSIAVPGVSTSADTYERVGFFAASVTANSGTETKYYVKVSDLQTRATALGVAFIDPTGTATEWVEYVAGGAYAYATPIAPPNTNAAMGLTAILFDNLPGAGATPPQIRLVGFVQPGTTMVDNKGAISASCWSSVQA